MRVLTLDDMKIRQEAFQRWFIGHELIQVYTAAQAIEALKGPQFDLVHLDHDLAEEHYLIASEGLSEERLPGQPEYLPGTGMDVVDFIVSMSVEQRPSKVIVHSLNNRGYEMCQRLLSAHIWNRWVRFNPDRPSVVIR